MRPAELEQLLAAATPFLDVRAPAEFQRGAVPGAVNLPLLTDAERHRVGIAYKQHGHDAAVALGNELVSGSVREDRERVWCAFASSHPQAWIYCWRGGERSATVQQWLERRGVKLPRVPGGFKALRHACLATLDRAPQERRWFVLGGRTGTGKTELLVSLKNGIDLEGLARHRGSAFGAREAPQPPPVTFENALACAWLRHPTATAVVEDESRTIGRLALPQAWHSHMQTVPLALLEVSLEQRVSNIQREYVTDPLQRGVAAETLRTRYQDALRRIERRLGGVRRQAVEAALNRAFDGADHGAWIEPLLVWYYDPMYDHQLSGKRQRIVVQGCPAGVREFLLGAESDAASRAR